MGIEVYEFIQQIFLVTMILLLPATLVYLIFAYKRFQGSEFKKLLGLITLTYSAMGVGFLVNSIFLVKSYNVNVALVMSALYVLALMLGFTSALDAYRLSKKYSFK